MTRIVICMTSEFLVFTNTLLAEDSMQNPNNLELNSATNSLSDETNLSRKGSPIEFQPVDFDSSDFDSDLFNSSDPKVRDLNPSDLNLKQPSKELDERILWMARSASAPSHHAESAINHSVERTHFGWPTLISTAIGASLFGIVLGNSLNSGDSRSNVQVVSSNENMAALLDSDLSNSGSSNLKLPTQTLASLEVQASVEKFNLLHGHSSQAEFSDCSACHVQGGTLESKVSPHGLRGSKKSSSKKSNLEKKKESLGHEINEKIKNENKLKIKNKK